MNSEIRVPFEVIAGAEGNITSARTDIGHALEDLRGFTDRLTTSWTGSAADQYHVQQTQVDNAWRDLNDVLGQIGAKVGSALESYRATEQAITQRWAT